MSHKYSITPEGATEAAKEMRALYGTVIMEAPEYVPSIEEGAAIILRHAEQSPARFEAMPESAVMSNELPSGDDHEMSSAICSKHGVFNGRFYRCPACEREGKLREV